MVEYFELMNANNRPDGAAYLARPHHWPLSVLDEQIAELDFGSSLMEEQSMFSSIGLDVALISTDSLDMEQLRQRCETNKNDYKIAFEDSGQWTTSGFGTGASPSNGATTGLEEFSSDERTSYGNESLEAPNGNLTTWGRIRSVEPFDDHTKSMPSHVQLRSPLPSATKDRPTSLVANFMGRQSSSSHKDTTSCHKDTSCCHKDLSCHKDAVSITSEGRLVDVNENELDCASASTSRYTEPKTEDRWEKAHKTSSIPPKRTFAELEPSKSSVDLKFLHLPFYLPSFCRTSAPLDQLLKEANSKDRPTTARLNQLRKELDSESLYGREMKASASSPSLGVTLIEPDSGLGRSSSGPLHIEDWPSLSLLLPKNVVETCCFFKSNVSLLGGSQVKKSGPWLQSTQSEKPSKSTPTAQKPPLLSRSSTTTLKHNRHVKLNAAELANIGLPSYDAKRRLVEAAVEGVAGILRGESAQLLFRGLEQLIADGLLASYTSWDVVLTATKPGKATGWVHDLVLKLENEEKNVDAQLRTFLEELLKSHSLDGWLSYVVMKERELCSMYSEDAFLLHASTAYRSLFWRLIESLELLSVLSRCQQGNLEESFFNQYDASKLPSDSRVPKSSSVPARLGNVAGRRGWSCTSLQPKDLPVSYLLDDVVTRPASKIPVSFSRETQSTNSSTLTKSRRSRSLLAKARESTGHSTHLSLVKGEPVRVLDVQGGLARVARLETKAGQIAHGTVPTKYLQL
ncbi:unnamed protein product [Bursaphelenchus okinawaensis]|uniref:RUN domain-containing protein n=1 Tax=Bursaphelenchus okinawaensis TaxID=465554 RepID=A0A811JV39_9BILA|nr:unnamed protein product [Bursaphelenchus okinawaensis]CAG9084345.1 unnamed protein product [Bursaphelenchus okinawaensis]